MGGVLCGYEEWENQHEASMENVLRKTKKICTKYTWENLNNSKQLGITPTELAYKNVEEVIYK